MDLVLFLVLLLSVCQLTKSEHCQDPPSEIKSLMSLERSILCDEYNIQSLTEAFFPANRRQAFVVEVHIYVNRSEHPLSPGNNETAESDYVFIWFSSSVLAFIHPTLLEGFSLRTFSAEFNYAHLRIAPFFSDDEDWIRGLLSNATIWLKSYAENRYSTVLEGVTISSQGFSTYRPNNTTRDDYFINNPPLFYQLYVFLLGVSFVSITALICISFPFLLLQQYPKLHKLSNIKKNEKSRLKFRNLFWGMVLALGCFTLGVLIFAAWHVYSFGLQWETVYSFIYPMMIIGLVIVYFYSFVWAVVVTIKATKKNSLIMIPPLLYLIFCLNPKKQPVVGSVHILIQILWQGIAFFVIESSLSTVAFCTCGILLALFVDPVQVITNVAIYVTTFLCVVYAFGIVFELTDELKIKGNINAASRIPFCLKIFVLVFILFLVVLFVIIFGFTYASIVFFAGSTDQLNLFSSIGELLPIVIASVVGWGLRHQFQTYVNQAKMDSTTNRPILSTTTEIEDANVNINRTTTM